jgi:hypothetical protein
MSGDTNLLQLAVSLGEAPEPQPAEMTRSSSLIRVVVGRGFLLTTHSPVLFNGGAGVRLVLRRCDGQPVRSASHIQKASLTLNPIKYMIGFKYR